MANTRWTVEKIIQLIEDEGITGYTELCEKHTGAYQYIYRNNLYDQIPLERKTNNFHRWSLDEVNELIREKHYTTTYELKQEYPGAINFIYGNNLTDQLVWPFGHFPYQPENKKKAGEYRKRQWHDITKVLHYLYRWADEEGLTMDECCSKYGYSLEWNVYKKDNNISENPYKTDL